MLASLINSILKIMQSDLFFNMQVKNAAHIIL